MDRHHKAARAFLQSCRRSPSVLGVLAYGSFARGDYSPKSDIDLAILLDSSMFSESDAERMVRSIQRIKRVYNVRVEADFILDSEVELFNRGILLDGRAFSDRHMYLSEGKVLYGRDPRDRFVVPADMRRFGRMPMFIIEEHFKRWLLQNVGRNVPWWFPSWSITVAVNLHGMASVAGRAEMFRAAERLFPKIKRLREYRRVKANPRKDVLRADEFLALLRVLKREVRP